MNPLVSICFVRAKRRKTQILQVVVISSVQMLEGPSFPAGRDFPKVCEQETEWIYDGFTLLEPLNFKRKSEDREDPTLGTSLKLLKINKAEESEADFSLSLALAVYQTDNVHGGDEKQSDDNEDQSNEGDVNETRVEDQSDSGDHASGGGSDSLISHIGRDNSIECIARCSRSDYGSIASLNRGFRSLIGSKELYKLRRKLGIVEHWVYFSCSLLEWEVFDPKRRGWKHLPRMPSNDCFMHSDKESLAVGPELLVFGKGIASHIIYKYSLLTNSWSTGMEMNTPRCLFGSSSLGEIAIVAGGCDLWGNVFASAELYNSEMGVWAPLPNMNRARKKCSAVFMDGKFYVMGGLGVENANPLTCGEVFDLERRTWTVIPDMLPGGAPGASVTSEAPPLLAVVDNELYAADYARKEVRKYDKVANTWSTVGTLPERAFSMNGWGLAFRGCGDELIVIGGPRALEGGYIEVNAWNPSVNPQRWTVLGRKQSSGGFVYNCAIMGC